MSRLFGLYCSLMLICITLSSLVGCGSKEPDATTANASSGQAADASASEGASAAKQQSSNDEQGDSAASAGGGESYGDGSYRSDATASTSGGHDSEGGEGNAMSGSDYSSQMGDMAAMGGGESSAMSGSDYSMGDMTGSSYDGSSAMGGMHAPNSGGSDYSAMGGQYANGYGGAGTAPTGPSFDFLAQFIRQNCLQCHSGGSPKGDVELASLSDNFLVDSATWSRVAEQLESDAMPPETVTSRPDPTQKQTVVSFIRDQLNASGGVEKGYLARAKSSFGSGKEAEALKYLSAYVLVAEESEAASILSQSRWFPAGRRPASTLRFAAGVQLDAPSSATDLKPIGSKQLDDAAGGGGGGGGGGMSISRGRPGGPAANTGEAALSNRSFYDMTGDLGGAVVDAFKERWTAGQLGTIFSDAVAVDRSSFKTVGAANGNSGGAGGYGDYEAMAGGGRSAAMTMGAELGGSSDYSSGGDSYGGDPGGGSAGEPAGEPRPNIRAGQSLTAGLVFLGTDSQQELIKQAAEKGYDGIFVFDIKVSSPNPRTGTINHEAKVRLFLTNGEVVGGMSGSLENVAVERARQKGEDDGIAKNIERMFSRIDEKLQLVDMPVGILPEHAKKRIQQMINDPLVDPMTTMFETRLFNSLGLITQDDMATIFQIILKGNEGMVLAEGTPQDRLLVMQELLRKN